MSWRVASVVKALDDGAVIAYPTEGVWGLGCDPWNAEAVEHLLSLKHRKWQKGLILVASSMQQIDPLLQTLSADQRLQLHNSWPGPDTWIINDPMEWVPRQVKGQHPGVAVRVSTHPGVKALCDAFGGPLVSTSANKSGFPPLKFSWQVRRCFATELGAVLEGQLGQQQGPSQIRDLETGGIVRPA